MSNKIYYGNTFTFTDRNAGGYITMKAGVDETLSIKNANITSENGFISLDGTSAQSINNVSESKLTTYWTTATISGDSDAPFTYSSGNITVGKTGVYMFAWSLSFASNAVGLRSSSMLVNDDLDPDFKYGYHSKVPINGDRTGMNGSAVVKLNAGDFVSIYVYHSSGGALGMDSLVGGFFNGYRLG